MIVAVVVLIKRSFLFSAMFFKKVKLVDYDNDTTSGAIGSITDDVTGPATVVMSI